MALYVANDHALACRSRRTLLRGALALGLAALGVRAGRSTRAAGEPAVTVSPPTIARRGECFATVRVQVTIAELPAGARYEVSGKIMEGDEPDGDPDVCCALDPQTTSGENQMSAILRLTAETAAAADLGLVKGFGPASDETYSPDLVELFARVWLRDLATDERYGPWESPYRIAVSRATPDWTHAGDLPGRELMTPRGGMPGTAHEGRGASTPPPACLP